MNRSGTMKRVFDPFNIPYSSLGFNSACFVAIRSRDIAALMNEFRSQIESRVTS